ncbi:hypothetical protein EQG41_19700 [Billgrantia azerbaijanica]|nr:hypothetical protein EQG41_19700 [Halomonas azerbaijanica]
MKLQHEICEVLADYPGGATIDVIQEELEDRGHITFHDLDQVTDITNKLARAGTLARSGQRRAYVFKLPEGEAP